MIKDHFLIRWMSADPWCRRCCELVQEVAMLIRLYLQFGPWISSINDAVWYNSSSKLLQTWIDDLLSAIAMLVFELCRIGTNTSFAQLFSFSSLAPAPASLPIASPAHQIVEEVAWVSESLLFTYQFASFWETCARLCKQRISWKKVVWASRRRKLLGRRLQKACIDSLATGVTRSNR